MGRVEGTLRNANGEINMMVRLEPLARDGERDSPERAAPGPTGVNAPHTRPEGGCVRECGVARGTMPDATGITS